MTGRKLIFRICIQTFISAHTSTRASFFHNEVITHRLQKKKKKIINTGARASDANVIKNYSTRMQIEKAIDCRPLTAVNSVFDTREERLKRDASLERGEARKGVTVKFHRIPLSWIGTTSTLSLPASPKLKVPTRVPIERIIQAQPPSARNAKEKKKRPTVRKKCSRFPCCYANLHCSV